MICVWWWWGYVSERATAIILSSPYLLYSHFFLIEKYGKMVMQSIFNFHYIFTVCCSAKNKKETRTYFWVIMFLMVPNLMCLIKMHDVLINNLEINNILHNLLPLYSCLNHSISDLMGWWKHQNITVFPHTKWITKKLLEIKMQH